MQFFSNMLGFNKNKKMNWEVLESDCFQIVIKTDVGNIKQIKSEQGSYTLALPLVNEPTMYGSRVVKFFQYNSTFFQKIHETGSGNIKKTNITAEVFNTHYEKLDAELKEELTNHLQLPIRSPSP